MKKAKKIAGPKCPTCKKPLGFIRSKDYMGDAIIDCTRLECLSCRKEYELDMNLSILLECFFYEGVAAGQKTVNPNPTN